MPDAITPNFGMTQPEDGGSFNTWGPKANADLGTIDTLLALPRPLRKVLTTPTAVMNLGQANYFKVTVDQNTTLSFAAVPADVASPFTALYAAMVFLEIVNGSAHTLTFPGSVTWLSGGAPSLQASGTDLVAFWTYDNGTTWVGAKLMSAIDTADIFNDAITAAKIAANAVTTTKIADGNVTTAKLADGAVTSSKLAAASAFRLAKSAAQTVAANTDVDVTWDVETFDTDGFHSGSSANVTIPTGLDGLYLVTAHISWDNVLGAGAVGARVQILKNGTAYAEADLVIGSGLVGVHSMPVTTLMRLVATDVIKVQVRTGSTFQQIASPTAVSPFFEGVRLTP